jgi:hypothetical protein
VEKLAKSEEEKAKLVERVELQEREIEKLAAREKVHDLILQEMEEGYVRNLELIK